ncbi:MAG: family 20 glycosylhydrolase [Sedimentisphaerales bacterium]|nr:family 20 glycosylhydrolase [Sedimentisphaerales bacterium]
MNMHIRVLGTIILTSLAFSTASQCDADSRATISSPQISIVPEPVALEQGEGQFRVTRQTQVIASGEARAEGVTLIDSLAPALGYRLKMSEGTSAADNSIGLRIGSSVRDRLGEDGYELEVTGRSIRIAGGGAAGVFYGVQTLRQLLPSAVFSPHKADGIEWTVPCLYIADSPRFRWRGLLIDPARHFIPVSDVKKFIDVMALHKLNRLQIHLTDNEGWRIEIKKYPKLTKLGSKMDWNLRHQGGSGPRCFGFYTQDDIRELVRYAADRHITIVPEIEMPFHTGAAIVAYPELAINPGRLAGLPVEQRWAQTRGLIAPRPETVAFLQDVLSEVIELFPSKHIHIGGDEANIGHWTNDPEMQAQMKRLKLKDAHELHSWFIKQMDAFLTKNGRRLVGWDEILQGGLAPGATVMSWRGTSGGIAAAQTGHDVVMAPTSHTYFDYRQARDETGLGGSVIDLEKVYAFEPIPTELNAEQARHVLGGQGQFWGELIADPQRRDFMAFPRGCALSEVLWSPEENRSFRRFLGKLLRHLPRLKLAQVNYRPLDRSLIERVARSTANFDYFTNNWNVVGLKDYTHGSRITPDNRLVLANKTPIEIHIGPDHTQLSRENPKLAQDGWMPIIIVTAEKEQVDYEVAYWATPLPDVKDWRKAFDWPTEGENFLNWIRVKATNNSDKPVQASVEIGPNLQVKAPRTPEEQSVAKADVEHTRKYSWSWRLAPGESSEEIARYPFFPVENPEKYDGEDAHLWLRRTTEYWQGVMDRAAKIEVPCRKATEALLAAHVCQLIANDHGEVHGGEDFYDVFYIRDGAYQVMELEEAGLMNSAAKAIALYLVRQRDDGRFESQNGQFDANGQAVWTLWQYYRITRDRAFLERVYPQMVRAAQWTMKARRSTAAPFAGLLPTAPADGEYLWGAQNHIVGYDVWNLRAMLCTAEAARVLEKDDEAAQLRAEAEAYRADFDAAWKNTGLKHFPPSWEKDGTHWGNTETLWPTELFERDDPRVAALSRHVREDFAGGYIEGTIQWKGGGNVQAIHPYMGAYTTMTDLVRGEHEQVVEDFYWYLLHSTAAHAFPEGIYYKRRMAWGHTIPHVTGACNYAIMLRHMLVHEAGEELHLLAAVPDWWLEEGREICLERLPTHFGEMALTVRGTAEGVEVDLDPPKRNPPERIVLTLPKSRPLASSLPNVRVVQRPDQKKRWDFPTMVDLYERTYDWAKPNVPSLTTGKPATCSHALSPNPANLANDGRSDDTDSYWATDVQHHPGDAWWQVDLEKPTAVGRIVVVGYYGDTRHYGFTVETSTDGKDWDTVADRTDNETPSTRDGYTCRFAPRPVRYIRVTQTRNSANTGRHLVEVMAFEK